MKIGLLPFYIKLYDDRAPKYSAPLRTFPKEITAILKKQGFEVLEADACRIESEFEAAVKKFEQEGCQAIATVHLAYSPSLESIRPLSSTDLPIVVLDTTPDGSFNGPDQVMPNHGIHGVQDFCNLLLRNHKNFLLATGFWQDAAWIEKVTRYLKAAGMAWRMTHGRIGSVGGEFAGMGDFRVPEGTFGMTIVPYDPQPTPGDDEIAAELQKDHENFIWDENLTDERYVPTLKASLKLRNWIEKEKLDAFTVCFLGITYANGWDTVPFLECSKAIARGIGYAGEGDVLTALLSRCLADVFPETSFTEMFCPDWKGNRIFTSHMGEYNISLSAAKPLLQERDYIYSDTGSLVKASGCFKAGKAILTDLAPGPDGTFTLITAAVTYLPPYGKSEASIEGWFRPDNLDAASFLEEYSKLGGTHHLVASYNADPVILRAFANMMGWKFAEL